MEAKSGVPLPKMDDSMGRAAEGQGKVKRFYTGELDMFAICEHYKYGGAMHIISRKKILEVGVRHADLAGPLDSWYRIAKKATWKTLIETREAFPTADSVGTFTVFNIKGNEYRLIAEVFYASQTILIRAVLTHAEYDKGKWK